MRPSLCWSCLASILKLLNFLQTFVGVSIILYSAWILNHLIGNNIDFGFSFDFDKLPAPRSLLASYLEILCGAGVRTAGADLSEAVLVGDLVLNKRWEEDLPYDSTGELQRLRTFIEDNIDMSEWIGVTVVVIQVVSLLLAMILRTMIPRRKLDYDGDEDFIVIRRPLLNPQSDPTYASTTVDGKGHHIWNSRMRQKYGLNQN